MSPVTRPSLILRLRDHGDGIAWNEFVKIYEPLVYRQMTQAGLQPADATEQTQEVMTAVANAINRWEPDESRGKFRTWLFRIARNILVDFWKSRRRTPMTGLESTFLNDSADSASQFIGRSHASTDRLTRIEDWIDWEVRSEVFRAAAARVKERVKPQTWSAFWKATVLEQSVESIAAELDVSVGSVYVAKSRVMKQLQEAARNLMEDRETPR